MAADPSPHPHLPGPEDLRAHTVWLRRLARQIVGSPALADDVAQEAWTAAVAHPPARAEAWRSWLRTVLYNCVRGRARADCSRDRRESTAAELAETSLPSSEELLVRNEALAFVAEEVRRLREPYRSTVLLCYGEDVPPSEIARRQGSPAGTVRWRLKQGLDQLRRRIEERYGDRRAFGLVLGLTPPAGPPALAAGAGGAAAGLAVALVVVVSLVLSFWVSLPAPELGAPLEVGPRNARLADAGPQLPEPWPQGAAPLLVQNRLPDEDLAGERLRRM